MVLLSLQRAPWYPVASMLLVCFCQTAIMQKLNAGCSFIFWAFAITLGATTVKVLVTSVTVKPKVKVASLQQPWNGYPFLVPALCWWPLSGVPGSEGGSGPCGRAGEKDRSHWMRCSFLACPTACRSVKATAAASLKTEWQILAVPLSVVCCGALHLSCLPQLCKCARILISHFSWSRWKIRAV